MSWDEDMPKRILVVEDAHDLAAVLRDRLQREGYSVDTASDGPSALKASDNDPYDLMILDVMLPEMSGFDVCREVRRRNYQTPILILTAKSETADKISGLRLGADDYMTKPFDLGELVARVEALMRRVPNAARAANARFEFGDVVIDLPGAEVRRAGTKIDLTAREFLLLRHLIEHRGTVQPRDTLLKAVWNYDSGLITRTLDVHIAWLRTKLEADPSKPRFIVTVRGLGYKFVE
jgi:two-component system, OmpR family, alkaline phosphatase synthesis response regulator PhoP